MCNNSSDDEAKQCSCTTFVPFDSPNYHLNSHLAWQCQGNNDTICRITSCQQQQQQALCKQNDIQQIILNHQLQTSYPSMRTWPRFGALNPNPQFWIFTPGSVGLSPLSPLAFEYHPFRRPRLYQDRRSAFFQCSNKIPIRCADFLADAWKRIYV